MKCDYIKAALFSLGIAGYAYLCGGLTWMVLFGAESQANTSIWRDMGSKIWVYGMPIGYIVLGFALTYVYCLMGKHICCDCSTRKGLRFGLAMFLVAGLPGSIFAYVVHPVPEFVLSAMLTENLLIFLGSGLILSKLWKCSSSVMACDVGGSNWDMKDHSIPEKSAPTVKKSAPKKAPTAKAKKRKKSK